MIRLVIPAALVFAAGPALANYGDVDAQISIFQAETFGLVPDITEPQTVIEPGPMCDMGVDHLVSIPVEFQDTASVDLACSAPIATN